MASSDFVEIGQIVPPRRLATQDRAAARQRLLAAVREVFGDPLAEVILTHDPEHLTGLDAAVKHLSDDALAPLREALSIANDLRAREADSVIRAWFVGLNPILGDREPALVIRDDPQVVRNAARALLASG